MVELYIKMIKTAIIKKLPSGKYRLYSKKKDKSGHRRNLGTFNSYDAAMKHEKQVHFFKGQGADDQETMDKDTQALKLISEMGRYLESAGMIEEANEMYALMDDVDGSLDEDNKMEKQFSKGINYNNLNGKEQIDVFYSKQKGDRNINETKKFDDLDEALEYFHSLKQDEVDNLEDASMIPDTQRNVENMGNLGDTGFSQGTFNAPEAERLAGLANKLDKLGLYQEADKIDEILTSIANPYDYEIDEMRYEEEMENKRISDLVQKVKQDYESGMLDNLIKNNRIETYLAKLFGMNPNNEVSSGFLNGLMVSMEAIKPNEAGGDPEAYQSALALWNNPYEMDNVDMLTHSNGLQTSTNDATNQFNGLSDSYFYSNYTNLDHRYKIAP